MYSKNFNMVTSSKLNISDISSFVKGCCDACKKVNCVLLGGETAEMPSIYRDNHLDMVGTIVGEKKIEIHGVRENDIAIGLPSSGPQTNGYTLIRKILEKFTPPQDILSQLIEPHSSFLNDVSILTFVFFNSLLIQNNFGFLLFNLLNHFFICL